MFCRDCHNIREQGNDYRCVYWGGMQIWEDAIDQPIDCRGWRELEEDESWKDIKNES